MTKFSYYWLYLYAYHNLVMSTRLLGRGDRILVLQAYYILKLKFVTTHIFITFAG
jgi:hypothetical protein